MGKLWTQLLTKETLTRGWHLARADTQLDFAEDLYSTDAFAQTLPVQVEELINRVRTGTYQPLPLFRIEVPKGPLGFRPGSVVHIQDRVLLSAIILLIAGEIDKKLPNTTFSWRLKDPIPKKGAIFKNSDITDLPFLKKQTIREEVDPFAGWYVLWPEFDKRTRSVFQSEGYRFLATSDIAGYFENIQLPILRDQLLTHVPKEPELVNLLCHILESWADRTADGRLHHRGIPQGNFVSSFIGNIFLLPLDETFAKFCKGTDAAYFRYMDDVRIFTKRNEDARRALFLMARRLRELHLNVQTAKTKIFDESRKEITRELIDPRTDALSDLLSELQSALKARNPNDKDRKVYGKKLQTIVKMDVIGAQKIFASRAPLEGLAMRTFSRWVTGHMMIESPYFIPRLLSEIGKSADNRLTKKLVASTKRFPKNRSISTKINKLISDRVIIFPYQEAECYRALRYLSVVSIDSINIAWSRLTDKNRDRYLRMQASYLLSRTQIPQRRIAALFSRMKTEPDPYVRVAFCLLLVQNRSGNGKVIREMVFHPNEKIRSVGKYLRTIKNDEKEAHELLKHAFNKDIQWRLCDYMPLLHVMADSSNPKVRKKLLVEIAKNRRAHKIVGLRPILDDIHDRTKASLV